jgi:STAS-like domain of unknown function (DUF4325)
MENGLKRIDLQEHAIQGITSFNTRSWGIKVRNESNIDTLVNQYDKIVIHVPNHTDSINTPFLEELLRNVVFDLGYNGFKDKIVFENNGAYKIDFYISEAISRILRKEVAYAY